MQLCMIYEYFRVYRGLFMDGLNIQYTQKPPGSAEASVRKQINQFCSLRRGQQR